METKLEIRVNCCKICSDIEIVFMGKINNPIDVVYIGVSALKYARGRVEVKFGRGIDKEAKDLFSKIVELYNKSLASSP